MERRRYDTIRGNIDLYVILVVLASLFHLFDKELAGKPLYLQTVGFSYLLLLYIGYKFGRVWGAAAGVLSAGVWTVLWVSYASPTAMALWSAAGYDGELLDSSGAWGGIRVMYASLQYVLLFGAIGYLAGWVMDAVEAVLARRGATLEDLLPRRHDLYLHHIGAWVVRVVRALFLFQVETEDKKAVILSRLRKLFVVLAIIPLLYGFSHLAFVLVVQVSHDFSFTFGPLAPVLVLWIAYALGPRQGVVAALGLLLIPLAAGYLEEIRREFDIDYYVGIASPSGVFALAVAAWVVGNVGRSLHDPALRAKLLPAVEEPAVPRPERLKAWHMLLLVLLASGFGYYPQTGWFHWSSFGVLTVAAIWAGAHFDVRQVSNTILILLGLCTLFHLSFSLYDYGLAFDFGRQGVTDVVFLALVPLLVAAARVTSLAAARRLVAGVFGLAWLTNMVTSGFGYDALPNFSASLAVADTAIPAVPIVAVALLVEVGARGLWALGVRQPQSAAPAASAAAAAGEP